MAFGNANSFNTSGKINVERTIFGQAIAGLIFSVLSTQPMGLLMTTPPTTLLIALIYKIGKNLEVNFLDFYNKGVEKSSNMRNCKIIAFYHHPCPKP